MTYYRKAVLTDLNPEERRDVHLCGDMSTCFVPVPIDYEADQPMLGLATTRQLIEELTVRIEMDGMLDYRTVDAAVGKDKA